MNGYRPGARPGCQRLSRANVWCLLFVGIALAAFTGSARAYSFEYFGGEANTEVSLALQFSPGGPVFGDSDTAAIPVPGPQFFTFAQAYTNGFDPYFGEAAAYQDQYGINAVFLNANNALEDAYSFVGLAKSHYEARIRTTEPVSGTIPFTFVINSGQLRIDDFSKYDPFLPEFHGVGVSAAIVVGPETWRFTALLSKDSSGNPVVRLDQFMPGTGLLQLTAVETVGFASNDAFGVGFPALSMTMDGDSVIVDIERFEATIDLDLDDFAPARGGVRFQYSMAAGIDIEDSVGVSGFAGISDPFGLADPTSGTAPAIEFYLDEQPFSAFTPVPLPPGAWLLLSGAGALVAWRRKRFGTPGV